MRVTAHQLTLRDHVTVHRFVEFLPFCAFWKVESSIKRENFEVITMRARRRLRSAITQRRIIIRSLHCAFRRTLLGDFGRLWIDVPEEPVREQTYRRVGIIHNQDQTLCVFRHAFDAQRRTRVPALAAVLRWNFSTFLER